MSSEYQKRVKLYSIEMVLISIVLISMGVSFAFFDYSKMSRTKIEIFSGDITFSYLEDKEDAKIINAFPVADSVGAVDVTGEYEFTVDFSSSKEMKGNYNVILLDNNKETKNYFTNDQIKFALIKNNVFVAGTSSKKGLKLSTISGFDQSKTTGEGPILENQEIKSGARDTYLLRIWISDDVSYNNSEVNGLEIGMYNGYTYSLKVRVTGGVINN